jgi:hypothetical protein
MLTVVQIVLPALLVFTTLFGLLARGNPRPGGVALFMRVGLVGLLLGGALYFLIEKTSIIAGRPQLAVNVTAGFLGGGLLLVLFAAFGFVLKGKRA